MTENTASIRLELAAAKAKLLAEDIKHDRLWPGELLKRTSDICSDLEAAQSDARRLDPNDR